MTLNDTIIKIWAAKYPELWGRIGDVFEIILAKRKNILE